MAMKIRREDSVVVISGKDKGKTGRVTKVDPKRERVFVEGVNIVKRHQRPRPGTTEAGGVVESERSVHVSNVMLLDPKDSKPTRVGIEREDGKRFRVSRRTGNRLD